jgi:hypothetical protein
MRAARHFIVDGAPVQKVPGTTECKPALPHFWVLQRRHHTSTGAGIDKHRDAQGLLLGVTPPVLGFTAGVVPHGLS